MIGYVTLGSNDLVRGAKFYDAIAAELGVGRMMEWENAIAWGKPGGGAGIDSRVANTVTMSVLEQQRSLGLLRAVGMRRGQVVGMVVLQSVLLGAAAGIVGLVAGVTTALFIQFASQPLLGHPLALHIRPGVVVANLLAALAVTALAAWLPARRAVKLELLEALSTE